MEKARSYSYDGLGNRIGIKEYERKIGYGEDGLKTILEEQFAFLSRGEKVKLYMVMMSLEEILITHRDRYSHSVIQVTDMIGTEKHWKWLVTIHKYLIY